MEGRYVFKHAVQRFTEVIHEALAASGYGPQDLDLLIPHQANLRISQMVALGFELPEEKVVNNIQRYGNTTAASIRLALYEAVEDGRVRDGSLRLPGRVRRRLHVGLGTDPLVTGAVPSALVFEPMVAADLPQVLEIERLAFANPWTPGLFLHELKLSFSRLHPGAQQQRHPAPARLRVLVAGRRRGAHPQPRRASRRAAQRHGPRPGAARASTTRPPTPR